MSTLNAIAGRTAEFKSVTGETLILKPIPLSSWGKLENRLKQLVVSESLALTEMLPEDVRKQHLLDTLEYTKKITLDDPEFSKRMSSYQGMLYFMYLTLKIGNPKLKEEEVEQHLSIQIIQDLERKLAYVNGMIDELDPELEGLTSTDLEKE